MAENVVEILVTSRNKTGAGFKEAEAEAEAAGGRISGIFSRVSDQIGEKLKTAGSNAFKGGGLFTAGSGILAMAGPIGAAGAAMGAFGAIAIPILAKVADAHSKLAAAQQAYNQASTKSQRVTALKAEKAATDGLTSSEKGLMGPVTQLQSMWGKLENSMAPLVVFAAKVGLGLAQDVIPAFKSLAEVGGNALETILGYLDQFVQTPFFARFIAQLGQMASAIAPLIGQSLVQLLRLFMQLFMQAGPAGIQLLNILLPLIIQLATDLVPVIAAVAEVTAKTLQWLQHTHLLLPVLALLAVLILSLDAPIAAVVIAVAVLIAIGVELSKNWHKIWTDIKNWVMDAFNWIKGHWPLLLAILTGPVGLAVLFIVNHFAQIRATVARVAGDIGHFFASAWDTIRHGAAALVDDVVNFFAQLPGRVLAAVGNLGSEIWSHVTGGLGAIGHFLGLAAGGVVGAAAGGVQGGIRLVGEQGPELVRLPSGSMMYPAGQTAGMLGGGGGGTLNVQLQFVPGAEDMLIRGLRNYIRVKGGNVQNVLGWGTG